MSETRDIQLYVAPAAAGKTAYVLMQVRQAASGLAAIPRVIVSSRLQARSWRRRLAESGGAIGVQVWTFDQLYTACLDAAGESYTELSEPVQYRLIRALVDELPLSHYAPLKAQPGFIQVLEGMFGELKAARVWPERFAQAVTELSQGADVGERARLQELADLYSAYQVRLQAQGWADRAGLGWLAVESLEERAHDATRDWPLVVVDGFDDFTPVQLALLQILSTRVGRLIVTLTGPHDAHAAHLRPLVHRRFDETRQRLEALLGVPAAPLPRQVKPLAPALDHLASNLFRPTVTPQPSGGALELVEAPDRAAEVRAALRWIKARLVHDRMRPGDVALLCRDLASYRAFVTQTAAEFGLPIRLVDGLPLRTNPAVAALLNLLHLMLPLSEGAPEPAMPRRLVVEACRSPYFDWSALPAADAEQPIGLLPQDADALDAVARWGRVLGGWVQWREALERLTHLQADAAERDEETLGKAVPAGRQAAALLAKLERLVRRLMPPPDAHTMRVFVGWFEDMIGPDPTLGSLWFPLPEEPTALHVVSRARDAAEPVAERDVAALQTFKDVLRGLVWAEDALNTDQTLNFPRFYDELLAAVDVAVFRLPVRPERHEVLVANVIQARGVPFRAVALLGLAEGEFPATLGEDPFLRDSDRQRLREHWDVRLALSTESAEAEFFYEAITRPRERLLLTRPRLADNGAPWQSSPFWEEVRRIIDVTPQTLTSESLPAPDEVASWSELMQTLAAHPGNEPLRSWVERNAPLRQPLLNQADAILRLRSRPSARESSMGAHDGDLTALQETFAQRFGAQHVWSASRLEAYRVCPHFFFVAHVLGLEPRGEPAEGLDARQLGNIYHHIMEALFSSPLVTDPSDLDSLLAALPAVAHNVLDRAPEQEGFRETAWWTQTRDEIVENVRRSLEALAEVQGDFVLYRTEAAFGLRRLPPLVLRHGDDQLCLRGFIDRVDRTPDGRVRVIDYKTAGPSTFTNRALTDGKRLQLPLYALGARDALQLGEPVSGFYWHVRHAQASPFALEKFGPDEALQLAVEHAWQAVRQVRQGEFVPRTPSGGCPAYCPAASFCWHYQAGFGG